MGKWRRTRKRDRENHSRFFVGVFVDRGFPVATSVSRGSNVMKRPTTPSCLSENTRFVLRFLPLLLRLFRFFFSLKKKKKKKEKEDYSYLAAFVGSRLNFFSVADSYLMRGLRGVMSATWNRSTFSTCLRLLWHVYDFLPGCRWKYRVFRYSNGTEWAMKISMIESWIVTVGTIDA